MFISIDSWFFDKVFQPFSDWFTDHTGRSPRWLAATFAYLYAAGIIVKQFYFPNHTLFNIVMDVFLFLILMAIATNHDRADKGKWDTSGAMNARRVHPLFLFMRVLGWPILVLRISDIFRNDTETAKDLFGCFQVLVLTCLLYFEACNTKPPAPPKKKKEAKLAHAST